MLPKLNARAFGVSIGVFVSLLLSGVSAEESGRPTGQIAPIPYLVPLGAPDLVTLVPPDAIETQDEPEPMPGAPAPPHDQQPATDSEPEIIASPDLQHSGPGPEPDMDEVNQYLWGVYQRSAIKRDGSGDFTWKDIVAAARLEMTPGDYVIVGMDRDFREFLYRAGLAMDAAGIRWTILSGFRDDFRQGLASGYKAHIGDSLHGGSLTTGGYGHGCAVDIADADGNSRNLWTWLNANGARLGLERPLAGLDPAHVQPRGAWHEAAVVLRGERLANKGQLPEGAVAVADRSDLNTAPPSEADLMCIGLHHHHLTDPMQADAPPESPSFKAATRAREAGKLGGARKLHLAEGSHVAVRQPPSSELAHANKAGTAAAETDRPPPHPKGRPLPRHAGHAIPAGAT
jgi:hypothetical protein